MYQKSFPQGEKNLFHTYLRRLSSFPQVVFAQVSVSSTNLSESRAALLLCIIPWFVDQVKDEVGQEEVNDKGEAEDVVNKIIKIESKNLLINKEDVFFSRRGFLKKLSMSC